MSSPTDRIAQLEREVAELRTRATTPKRTRAARPRPRRLLIVLGVSLALMLPAAVLAGGTFDDVPASHPFFNAIEEVAAAGVTQGCGDGTNYCPNGLVTRGQMAAFMSRLGALSPSRPPVVNATKLDGLDSSAFARPLYAVVNANGSLARGVGAESVVKGVGFYRVEFDRNVRNCSYSATIGLAGAASTESPGFITVVGDALSVNGVYVTTDDTAGANADRAFHLTVMCAGQTGGTAGLLETGAVVAPSDALASGENE